MSFNHFCVDFLYNRYFFPNVMIYIPIFPEICYETRKNMYSNYIYGGHYMTYEEFKLVIYNLIAGQLPAGTSVHLQKVRKNNGLELDGLTFSNGQSNISPTVFLNFYYEIQNHFPDLDAICKDILRTYEHNKSTENINVDFFTDYELVKGHLAFRIINYGKNKELLQTVPHIRYLDLAIVFYCLLQVSEKGNATILIHANHLKFWHVTADELYQQTCQNTPCLLPYEFHNMDVFLSEPSVSSALGTGNRLDSHPFCPMYILTNSRKLYGASCMLYPHLLEEISDKLCADLFILPSSIHEIIILPALCRSQARELADMVADINQTELAIDEVLSNHIYYYSRSEQTLSIC